MPGPRTVRAAGTTGCPLALLLTALVVDSALARTVRGQDRLRSMPGYTQSQPMRSAIPAAVSSGASNATWSDDGKSFSYVTDGKKGVSQTTLRAYPNDARSTCFTT